MAPNDSLNLYNVTDENGKLRDGNWYNYSDTANGSTTFMSFTASPAHSGSYAVELSGTLAQQGSFAGYGFSFTNPNDGAANQGVSFYDATVGGRYIGLTFYIQSKSMATTNCVGATPVYLDLIDQGGLDHTVVIPVTAAYQAVTVFFNQALSPGGATADPTNLYQVVFQPHNNGVLNYSYDLLVDDIRLVAAGAPGAPASPATPVPANVVDNMTNGSNQIQFTTGGSTPGYWYDYAGASSTMCPYNQAFFLASPGHVAQVIPGIPSMAVHFTGTQADYAGTGFWFSNGNAYTNISAYTQLVFWAKSSTGGSYNITFNDSSTNSCYGSSVNTTSFTPGAAWAAVTLTYNPSAGSYQFGSVSGTSGSNGCAGAASFAAHQLDVTAVANIQWQPGSGAYDLWLDNLYFQ